MSQTEPHETIKVRPIVVGNWKMNGTKAALAEALKVRDGLGGISSLTDVMICPPATLVMILAEVLKGAPVIVGGQPR